MVGALGQNVKILVAVPIVAVLFLVGVVTVSPTAKAQRNTPITIENVGFQTPESVLHDKLTDRYYVSNINGAPLNKDDNGFISQVSPSGEVTNLKWIDGTGEGVVLNAPKGMAVVGNKLYVSDIDTVRTFNRFTGQPIGEIPINGSTFLNDINAKWDGTVYVSDSGLDANFNSTGTDAIYKIQGNQVHTLVANTGLAAPNGLETGMGSVLAVSFSSNKIFKVLNNGTFTEFAHTPTGGLDGVARWWDGSLFVSSWEAGAVYRVSPRGNITVAANNVPAPADIDIDLYRNRLLIPLFLDNKVEIRSIH